MDFSPPSQSEGAPPRTREKIPRDHLGPRCQVHIQVLMGLLGVDLGLTSAFHPSADGQSERSNQTVEVTLRCFLAGDVDRYYKWTDYLPIFELEYNNLPHTTTGFASNDPRFLLRPRGIPDLLSSPNANSSALCGTSALAEDLLEELKNRGQGLDCSCAKEDEEVCRQEAEGSRVCCW
jgi:hypothetical protein